jgi:general secretion pathway protein B
MAAMPAAQAPTTTPTLPMPPAPMPTAPMPTAQVPAATSPSPAHASPSTVDTQIAAPPLAAIKPAPPTPPPARPQAPPSPPALASAKAASPAAAASTPSRLPSRNELPAELRAALPPLNVSGAVYAPPPGARMLFVNGLVLREGDAVAEGLTVERIGPSATVLVFRGQRFEVKH